MRVWVQSSEFLLAKNTRQAGWESPTSRSQRCGGGGEGEVWGKGGEGGEVAGGGGEGDGGGGVGDRDEVFVVEF
jgi:hypothetical protein